ncbi:MAG: MBL fold metallo-hydrolase [Lachnospiraceae bacterium]|nr:MBL fold metallo-hydrolase [Lachnospiraceae bacterium]
MKKIKRWEILTIGCLTRNKFWGEPKEEGVRECLATSSVICTGEANIVVDPSMDPESFGQVLFNRSGLRPGDIDLVYCTHLHGDHFAGIELFEKADWYMASGDCEVFKQDEDNRELLRKRMKPAGDFLIPDRVHTVFLPGHTPGLSGLLFQGPEGRVLASGDCIMTKDFFLNREGYYFDKDGEENRRSIEKAAQLAGIIIPGHGNYFISGAYR